MKRYRKIFIKRGKFKGCFGELLDKCPWYPKDEYPAIVQSNGFLYHHTLKFEEFIVIDDALCSLLFFEGGKDK